MKNVHHNISWEEYHSYYELSLYFKGIITNESDLTKFCSERNIFFEREGISEKLLLVIRTISTEKRVRLIDALLEAVAMIKGVYTIMLDHEQEYPKTYVVQNGMPLHIGLHYGSFIISDSVSYIMAMADQIIKVEDEVISEMFDDGTCFFRDQEGHRLNREYLDVWHRERSASVDNQIFSLLQKDFKGEFFNAFRKDNLTAGISLS